MNEGEEEGGRGRRLCRGRWCLSVGVFSFSFASLNS